MTAMSWGTLDPTGQEWAFLVVMCVFAYLCGRWSK